MDTKSLAGLESGWERESSLSAILKSRLASIDQRHQRSNYQNRFFHHQFSLNGDYARSPMASVNGEDEKVDEEGTDSSSPSAATRIDGVDDLDRAPKTEEDGASCYLCTHCGKGYDSEHELDQHLRQVRNGSSCESANHRESKSPIEEGGEYMDEEHTVPMTNDEMMDDEEVYAGSLKIKRSSSLTQGLDMTTRTASSDSPNMMEDNQQQRHHARAYSCKFCSKVFDSNSALNVHYTHTHRDKPQYECDLCGRVYGVKRELATHRRLHDGQPTHRCRQCGKEFGTKQLLRKHELWHTGERSHVCPQCGKAFFQKGHLTQHMMIHAGGRPHACHLCQKTFIFKFDLNRHMKIHAERVGNAEETPTADTTASSDLIKKSVSYESGNAGDPENTSAADSNGPTETNGPETPLLVDTLFPMASISTTGTASLPVNAVIQQLHQNSGNHHGEALGAGASSFGLLRAWTPSSAFLDSATNGQDQQNRAALAAAFAQALCQAQQQASLFAGFSASSPPLSHLFFEEQRQQQLQQQRSSLDSDQRSQDGHVQTDAAGASEHDSTSGSSPGTVDDHRETASMTDSPPPSTCDSCRDYRQRLDTSQKRIQDLERDLSLRQADVDALNSKIQRVADVASRLLESCSDFDKLWMLHSKQVYSQIQNILNALD